MADGSVQVALKAGLFVIFLAVSFSSCSRFKGRRLRNQLPYPVAEAERGSIALARADEAPRRTWLTAVIAFAVAVLGNSTRSVAVSHNNGKGEPTGQPVLRLACSPQPREPNHQAAASDKRNESERRRVVHNSRF
jgi:hypothetical protein